MGLIELKIYIKSNSNLSLKDICVHFHKSSSEIEPMLNKLESKGQIKKNKNLPVKCQSCIGCVGIEDNIIYN